MVRSRPVVGAAADDVRAAFARAAVQIIRSHGASALTARRVGALTGYSAASLYNYYENLDALADAARALLVDELIDALAPSVRECEPTVAGLIEVLTAYADRLVCEPTVFGALFSGEPLAGSPTDPRFARFPALWEQTFQGLLREGTVRPAELPTVVATLVYCVHGIVLLRLTYPDTFPAEGVRAAVTDSVHRILGGDQGARP